MATDDKDLFSNVSLSRRGFLQIGAAASAAILAPSTAEAASARELSFYNIHTDESLTAAYWLNGAFEPEALAAINHLLRDYRTGDVLPISIRLLDLLHRLSIVTETRNAFSVISGYRSPATNAKLRRLGHGVARQSLHMKGLAIDVRVPGLGTRELWQAALQLRRGGVGYYPRSGFVHVDVGRVRHWRGK